MITWIIIGIVAYLAIGLLTGIHYLINRGREMSRWYQVKITENHFDADDEIFAIAIVLIWPIIWMMVAVCRVTVAIERYIVVPAVNKKRNQHEKQESQSQQ